MIVLFLDIRAAFESVDRSTLYHRLLGNGVPEKYVSVLSSFKYFGSLITPSEGVGEELKSRTVKAEAAFENIQHLWHPMKSGFPSREVSQCRSS